MEGLISILIPCRNEEPYIHGCLTSVLAFERPADTDFEVLVLDGMSTDNTRKLIKTFENADPRIRCIDNPGKIQSTALNIGLGLSRGDWIMRLDAHTRYPADYLKLCFETAQRSGAANVGGICVTEPGGTGYQAMLVQALTTHKFGVGNSGFRTGAAEGPADTVPFGFFRRSLFDSIGKFDERLLRAQDYEFNRRARNANFQVWLNPKIYSLYYNQPTLYRFLQKQFFKEAPYNAYLWYLAPYAFAPRHAVTAVFAFGIIGGVILSLYSSWIAWTFSAVMLLYAVLAFASAVQQAVRYKAPLHAVVLPACFFLFHLTHGLGVLVGLARIATGTAPVRKTDIRWPGER